MDYCANISSEFMLHIVVTYANIMKVNLRFFYTVSGLVFVGLIDRVS